MSSMDLPHISIGMEFDNVDEAYNHYLRYARHMGFSVRKEHCWKGLCGIVKRRKFVCAKEGWRKKGKRDQIVKVHRAETRMGCKALITISLHVNGKYRITQFESAHNHELETPSKSHMLRSHRRFTSTHAAMADVAQSSGLRPKQTFELMSKQAGGRSNLGYMLEDYKNYLRTKRMKQILEYDTGGLLQYFQKRQFEDPSFMYAIQVDEDELITNIFWVDAQMRLDYERFGDVLCFDTTYKTNNYGRPFAPFLGVNHHKQTVFFGAALLYDETADTFKWLFATFVKAMSGKQPKTILTDQDKAMACGIASELPDTFHRICVWHMYQNACKHLSHVWNATETFKKTFEKCVYDYEEEDMFINGWNNMLSVYELHDNEWLMRLFEEREKWALVYDRNTFTADMVSTQRCESINKVLKDYLDIRQSMSQFFDNFENLVYARRYEENKSDVHMRQTFRRSYAPTMILQETQKFYTPEVYDLFEKEYKKGIDLFFESCEDVDSTLSFTVFDDENHAHKVTLKVDEIKVECSCKKFQFVGMLCRHIIRIFIHKQIRSIPRRYLLDRWSRDAAKLIINKITSTSTSIDNEKRLVSLRYSTLVQNCLKLCTIAATHPQTYEFMENVCMKTSHEIDDLLREVHLKDLTHVSTVNKVIDPHESQELVNECVDDTGKITCETVKGIKRREEKGHKRRRFKSAIEKKSKKGRGDHITFSSNMHTPRHAFRQSLPTDISANYLPPQLHSTLPYWNPSIQSSCWVYHPNFVQTQQNFTHIMQVNDTSNTEDVRGSSSHHGH